ncbi:MAG: peptidoglycan bridge formation glycyltransferase FemA/FemB family protein [Chloroflexi bacterium]|nr:MAG: peptidoglycan bridge formation glycyltransferase FemA/FemB family protein [Chloroflexota bacterium]
MSSDSSSVSQTLWDDLVARQQGHLLQTWAWGELKSRFGWQAVRLQAEEAAAQVLFRRLPLGLTIAYVPRGPMGLDWADTRQCRAFFSALHAEARRRRAVFLKLEPDLPLDAPAAETARRILQEAGFAPADTIQPRASLVVPIDRPEPDILAAMKQKTRYNIRLAEKRGVTVRQGGAEDVAVFHRLSLTTAERNRFGVHSLPYYQTAFRLFAPRQCALLLADYEGLVIAGLMVFRQGQTAYYLYGASDDAHRNVMAPYLLQWEAMRWARAQNCTRYDLWGIPDEDLPVLEAEFKNRQDGLWGVYRFKRGFGGAYVRMLGGFDFVYRPLLYRLYRLRR